MDKVITLDRIGKGIAAIFYLEPIVWYVWLFLFGSRMTLVSILGLWFLPTDSNILMTVGRLGFLTVLTMSTIVGTLILLRKSFRFRKIVYADALIVSLYLAFVCFTFHLESKWSLIENLLIGRVCLLSILWSELQKPTGGRT